MQNFFDRIAALSLASKLGIVAGVVALLAGGYYFFFYGDMLDEQAQLEKDGVRLQKEKADYEKRKREYLAFLNEKNALLEEQRELLRILPHKEDDIEQFIENVQAQIELAGLSKVQSVREAQVPVEMYVKIPIRMSLTGTYHQIDHFFKQVGELKRIVNIEDLSLEPVSLAVAFDQANALKANFVATTFMLPDKSTGVGQKGGTQLSSGGGH
jgi:type IV pilus assembly protein PilO